MKISIKALLQAANRAQETEQTTKLAEFIPMPDNDSDATDMSFRVLTIAREVNPDTGREELFLTVPETLGESNEN